MITGKQKVIIDTNVWISFAIGKQLKHLKAILNNPYFDIYICDKIITEINDVLQRPKIKKYVGDDHVNELNEIILLTTIRENYHSLVKESRDSNDNFLLSFANDINANF
jgi:uncharacterized protein